MEENVKVDNNDEITENVNNNDGDVIDLGSGLFDALKEQAENFNNTQDNNMSQEQASQVEDRCVDDINNQSLDNDTIQNNDYPGNDYAARSVKNCVPFDIHYSEKDDKKLASMTFLCMDEETRLPFTMSIMYHISNDEDEKFIKNIPFSVAEDEFSSILISHSMIINVLDSYVINGHYTLDDNFKFNTVNNHMVTLQVINSRSKAEEKIRIKLDQFVSILYCDFYIKDKVYNKHDLSLASIVGYNNTEDVSCFYVDNIESIVSMARAVVPKKGIKKLIANIKGEESSTTIGLQMKVSRYNGQEREIVQLLTPFDIGVDFDDEKFKGTTISDMQEKYCSNSSEFVGTLLIENVRLYTSSGDNGYMIIRGKSKDGTIKMFMFDDSLKEEIVKKINEY